MIESNLSQACILTDSKDSIQSLPQILIYLWSKTTSYKHCQIILFPSLLLEVNYNPSWLCFIYSESSNLLDTKCHTECGHRNSFPFALLAEISVTLPHLQAAIDNLVILFWQLDFFIPVACSLSLVQVPSSFFSSNTPYSWKLSYPYFNKVNKRKSILLSPSHVGRRDYREHGSLA